MHWWQFLALVCWQCTHMPAVTVVYEQWVHFCNEEKAHKVSQWKNQIVTIHIHIPIPFVQLWVVLAVQDALLFIHMQTMFCIPVPELITCMGLFLFLYSKELSLFQYRKIASLFTTLADCDTISFNFLFRTWHLFCIKVYILVQVDNIARYAQ